MEISAAWVGVIISILTILCGLVVWAIRSIMAPFKVALQNNTSATEHLLKMLDALDIKIEDHEKRLTEVEIVQHMRGCDRPIQSTQK